MEKDKEKTGRLYSMRIRLFVLLLILTLGFITVAGLVIRNSFRSAAIENRKEKISNQCVQLAGQRVEAGVIYSGMTPRVEESLVQMAEDYSGRALVISSSGLVKFDTASVDTSKYLLDTRVLQALNGKKNIEWNNTNENILLAMPLVGSNSGEIIGVLAFSSSAADIGALMGKTNNVILSVYIIMIVTAIAAILLLCNMVVRPFKQMGDSIRKVGSGLQTGMDQPRCKETTEIVSAFNVLLDHMNQQDQLRAQFVSNVSHELKTPITSMRVLADSLLSMPDAPIELYQDFMKDISSEIDREAKIISDLLELVKMDNSAEKLNIQMVAINDWLKDILHRLAPIAKKQNVDMVMESFRDVTAGIDPSKLSLAVSNLVENAVKYNVDKGYVHVSLNADHKDFFIKVEDNGVGIPESDLDKIFDRFYRVDKARSRDAGGTGLGLAITKSVVQMHKGDIKVYSKAGEGTTFSVRIPLQYKE